MRQHGFTLHRRRLVALLGGAAALRPDAANAQAQRPSAPVCEVRHGVGAWTALARLQRDPSDQVTALGWIETPRAGDGLRLRLQGFFDRGSFTPGLLTVSLTGEDPFVGAGVTARRPALATLTLAGQPFIGPAPVADLGALDRSLSSPAGASPLVRSNLAFLAGAMREGQMPGLTLRLPNGRELSYSVQADGLTETMTWLVAQEGGLRARLRARACIAEEAVGSMPCFITSACCDLLGLPDDAWELRTLRRFRDRHLAAMPGGAADIAAYYATAPRLLARIGADPARAEVLARLYRAHVFPSAVLARLGLHRAAHRRYARMMAMLEARYPDR